MNSTKVIRLLMVACATALFAIGCAAPQKAMDKKVVAGAVGQDYEGDINGDKGNHKYGPQVLAEETTSGGGKLYLHVDGYQSSQSTFLGIWGKKKYSYKVFAFDVTDGKVTDWAYTLYQPDEKYSHVFGFTLGYDDKPIIEEIKKEHLALLETSSGGKVTDW